MSRQETQYQWSQKYVSFRKRFQSGTISVEAWNKLDSAYDVRGWRACLFVGSIDLSDWEDRVCLLDVAQKIYSEKSRYLYDFWGPGHEEMSMYEAQGNVGLFYLLWFAIMFVENDVFGVSCQRDFFCVGIWLLWLCWFL